MADLPPLAKILQALELVRFDLMHAIQRSVDDFENMLQLMGTRKKGPVDTNSEVTSSNDFSPPAGETTANSSSTTPLVTEFPEALDRVLQYIADTGDGRTPVNLDWETELRPLLLARLSFNLRTNFNVNEKLPNYPNTLSFTIEEKKSDVVDRILSFCSCPFTIQRLCELMWRPTTHYKRVDRYLRAVERVVTISSTVEFPPIGDSTDLSILMPAQRFAAQLAAGEIGEEWLSNGVGDGDEDDYPSANVAASAMLILRGPPHSVPEPTDNSTTTELTLRQLASTAGTGANSNTHGEYILSDSGLTDRTRSSFMDRDDEPAQPTDNMPSVDVRHGLLHAGNVCSDSAISNDSYASANDNLPSPLFDAASPPPLDSVSAAEVARSELPMSEARNDAADITIDETPNTNNLATDLKVNASFDMFASACDVDDDVGNVAEASRISTPPEASDSAYMPSLDAPLEAVALEAAPHAVVSYTLPEPRRDNVSTSAEVFIPSANTSISESFSSVRNIRLPSSSPADSSNSSDVGQVSANTISHVAEKQSDSPHGEFTLTQSDSAASAGGDESISKYAVDLSKKFEATKTSAAELCRDGKPSTPPSATELPADTVPFDFVYIHSDESEKCLEPGPSTLLDHLALPSTTAQELTPLVTDENDFKPISTSTFTAFLIQPSTSQQHERQLPPITLRNGTDLDERMDVDDEESGNSAANSQGINVSNFDLASVAAGGAVSGDDEQMQDEDGSKILPNLSSVVSSSSIMEDADQQSQQEAPAASIEEPMQS